MNLEQLAHAVEDRLLGLGRRLWRRDPLAGLRQEIDGVGRTLRDRRAALERCRAERDAARRRLEENQPAAALLASEVEQCLARGDRDRAWRRALDLDRRRQQMAEDGRAVPRHDQAAWSLEFTIRQLERRLDRLHERLRTKLART
jgi:hypothetical protein